MNPDIVRLYRFISPVLFLAFLISISSCAKKEDVNTGQDSQVTTLGSVEVTAQLDEIRGELINDPLYDYAHVMKYRIIEIHRGNIETEYLYVGHYNPAKPRNKAADSRVPEIGGTVTQFNVGDIHRMALEVPIDDYFMGGIINKYFGEIENPVYWAIWTNKASR